MAEPIEFDDIRVGDRIRSSYTKDGVLRSIEGVINRVTSDTARGGTRTDKYGAAIARREPQWPSWENYLIELVSRPAPELPEDGVIAAWNGNHDHCPVMVRRGADTWVGVDSGGYQCEWRDDKIIAWQKLTVTPDGEVFEK